MIIDASLQIYYLATSLVPVHLLLFFLRMHIDAWLLSSFCLIPSLVAGYSFGGDWYRNLGDSGARASSIARPVQPGRACCARARLQATLPLDFKRSIPHLQPTYPVAFKRLIASPSVHTIPHHPDQMTLQSYCVATTCLLFYPTLPLPRPLARTRCRLRAEAVDFLFVPLKILGLTTDGTQGDYLSGDMRVVGLTATSSTFFRPYRHPSDRTDHTHDDSDDGSDDARDDSDDGCDDARDPTHPADDACCLDDARTT
ncbi:hypothetical protein EV121DRAFT_274834 [Schizophyllum commune]